MNGRRYLLDTNALIQILAGNAALRETVEDADFVSTSVMCQLEFLSYPDLTADEKQAFFQFLSQITVYDILANDATLARETVCMRTRFGLKMPDAIIAATALENDCELITADAHFLKQRLVPVVSYIPIS